MCMIGEQIYTFIEMIVLYMQLQASVSININFHSMYEFALKSFGYMEPGSWI